MDDEPTPPKSSPPRGQLSTFMSDEHLDLTHEPPPRVSHAPSLSPMTIEVASRTRSSAPTTGPEPSNASPPEKELDMRKEVLPTEPPPPPPVVRIPWKGLAIAVLAVVFIFVVTAVVHVAR